MEFTNSIITGTGSFIPTNIKSNLDFIQNDFYGEDGIKLNVDSKVVVEKLKNITGIEERRYADENMTTSQMAAKAAAIALLDAKCNGEELDQIIVAHNFGDVTNHTFQSDAVPALASRVKHILGIKNPNCIAYDILFGCPGWVQGVIQADAFIKVGMAKKCLIIGAETLSRVTDKYDRDSLIFSDGAGACILEASNDNAQGILNSTCQSHCGEELNYINLGQSYFPENNTKFMKMKGRKVYEYAMKYVPLAMKNCLDKSNINISELKKILIHQANEKMDEGMVRELFKLYNITEIPKDIMPMSIHFLGNSSVATVPTLFDLVRKKSLDNHQLFKGDVVMFASVGAGMNINAICYKI